MSRATMTGRCRLRLERCSSRRCARGGVKRWALVDFGGAVHCFTEAAQKSVPNCAYDPSVAKRAYQFMRVWLDDAFEDHARVRGIHQQ